MQESNFDLMIAKHFDIPKYQRYFDFYDTELEISILESLRYSDKNDEVASHSRKSSKARSKSSHRMEVRC